MIPCDSFVSSLVAWIPCLRLPFLDQEDHVLHQCPEKRDRGETFCDAFHTRISMVTYPHNALRESFVMLILLVRRQVQTSFKNLPKLLLGSTPEKGIARAAYIFLKFNPYYIFPHHHLVPFILPWHFLFPSAVGNTRVQASLLTPLAVGIWASFIICHTVLIMYTSWGTVRVKKSMFIRSLALWCQLRFVVLISLSLSLPLSVMVTKGPSDEWFPD